MLQGVLQGTQTIGQAFARMAGNLIISMTEAFAKMGLEWVKQQIFMTTAQTAGDATRLASTTATTAAGAAVEKAAASATITTDAAKAAAGAYSAIAGIPYVGPILAPIAAGVAFAAVSAFDSFDVGTPYVPSDRLAMVHKGEAVIPAGTAEKWRDGDMGPGGSDTHVHFNVQAMDAASVKSFFRNHSGAIAKGVVAASRGGNNALRTAMARA